MADINSDFPTSSYFRASDLPEPLTLTIAGLRRAEMKDGKIKPAVAFDEDDRELLLNTINRHTLSTKLGPDYTKWPKRRITIGAEPCQGPSGPTMGVRVLNVEPAPDMRRVEGFDDPLDDVLPAAANGSAEKPTYR